MKTTYTIGIALTVGTLAGLIIPSIYNRAKEKTYSPSQLRLEEILSIKELHLVRHRYTDLFYLHRKGNAEKPVRAIAQVPVTITAYIDLKQIQLVKHGDSITAVILPKAELETPSYEIERMTITKTRSFQLHAGKDHYAEVSRYLQQTMAARLDTIQSIAIENHILQQAETEAKVYVESLLKAVGRDEIQVRIASTVSPARMQILRSSPRMQISVGVLTDLRVAPPTSRGRQDDARVFAPERYMGVIISNR